MLATSKQQPTTAFTELLIHKNKHIYKNKMHTTAWLGDLDVTKKGGARPSR